MYDIAIIGLGPAGSTLARLLDKKFKIIAIDKKKENESDGFQKPCGGLLAPDAQKSLIRFNLTLPVQVLADPQIFSVKTIDVKSNLYCNYQRTYINVDRHKFDLWLKSLIPENVEIKNDTYCKSVKKLKDHYLITYVENGEKKRFFLNMLLVLKVQILSSGTVFTGKIKFQNICRYSNGLKTLIHLRFILVFLIRIPLIVVRGVYLKTGILFLAEHSE